MARHGKAVRRECSLLTNIRKEEEPDRVIVFIGHRETPDQFIFIMLFFRFSDEINAFFPPKNSGVSVCGRHEFLPDGEDEKNGERGEDAAGGEGHEAGVLVEGVVGPTGERRGYDPAR
mmetsp:Transcript_17024/g.38482  ORF Transcript_17024/g.38482 Transcript_17024/m.38482 type:complete len:118 (-) Transcript_17024:964-1317(-)